MKTIRWGIIGCGDVTEVKSGPGFQKAEGSALVAVTRRDARKAEDYARRHGVGRWYADADALIGDAEVDAVYIATPPGTHELYAMKVLAAGKPCYVEKPMARNAAEARRMTEAFAAKGVPLFVAYYRRAMPRYEKVRELLRLGVLGRMVAVSHTYADGQMLKTYDPIPWRMQPEHSGGGLFLDLGSHVLDLFDYFGGPLTFLRGHAKNRASPHLPVEDTVGVMFELPGGVTGSSEWSFVSEQKVDLFRLVCEKGTIEFSCFGSEPIRITLANGHVESLDIGYPRHVHQPMIQTIVNELNGTGTCPSKGDNGTRTQAVMDAALTSYYGGREDGFWIRKT